MLVAAQRIVLRLLIVINVLTVTTAQYLLFCPCMGRFGNQADQFLGSLAFSAGLHRTLVLPPWISYSSRSNKIKLISWDSVFNVSTLAQHHSVVTMETFMKETAARVWPEGERTSLCYSARSGSKQEDCNAKHGSPFGPFWDNFQVTFTKSIMFAPLNFNTNPENLKRWREKFPASSHPVLALTGAPASFPVAETHLGLQRSLEWTDLWRQRGESWVETQMGRGVRYLALHLRNGLDWLKACEHSQPGGQAGLTNLFSSAQCLGYNNQHGRLTRDLCLPSEQIIIQQMEQIIRETKLKHVYVASDNDHMIARLGQVFSEVKFYKQSDTSSEEGFLLDLVILGQSDHFIGNCVSSFSAFVKRTRDVLGLQSSFWTFSIENVNSKTEL